MKAIGLKNDYYAFLCTNNFYSHFLCFSQDANQKVYYLADTINVSHQIE